MTALTSSEINFSREDNQRESALEQLMEENSFLKGKISDLTGALKAREMEFADLLDRFNRLKLAVEQQDAVIAEIYAATVPSSIALEEYCAIRGQSIELSSEMSKPPLPPHNLGLTTFDGWKSRSSAAFLRHTNRRPRRSVSDYGLLSLESPEGSDTEDSKAQGNERTFHKKCRKTSAMLFEGIGDISASEVGSADIHYKAKFTFSGEVCELTYNQFLDRLGRPASRDLLDMIRRFIGSVLGPSGDGSPPVSKDYIDYEFYGSQELAARCANFFDTMDHRLKEHPAWCYASETTLIHARDGIEKYVMEKLSNTAMNCNASWKEEDDKLLHRMRLLSFITPDMLDVNPCVRNEVVWSIAEDELRKINCFKSPGDKINCIVRCCSIVFSVLNLSRGDGTNRPGADDFLPVFIYIVLKACVPRLYSNCEYIANFRNKADLMSKAGYCFVNLRSAIEFISVLEPTMLTVDPVEFNRKLAQAEKEYEAPAATTLSEPEGTVDLNKVDISP